MANVVGEHTIKANIIGGGTPISANIIQNKKKIVSHIQTYNQATTTTKGIMRIATLEEAITGIDNTIAITPYTLHNVSTYTAGDGINITNKVISVNDDIIATKEFVNEEINILDNQISLINNTINTYGDIVIYNAADFATKNQGLLADSALQPNDNISELVNNVGYITGITSSDIQTALGYIPYSSENPAGYITSESLPTVNNSTITIQKNGSDIESFNLNQPTNETINITVPTQTSDLTNNSGFITNAVNNLTNYYLKSETYTKTEVQQLIASIPQFSVVVVQTLPVTGERMVLYLVPKEGASPDVYNEYIWIEDDEDYELIGNTAIDLTDYVQFTDLATVATTGDYDDLIDKPIPPVGYGTSSTAAATATKVVSIPEITELNVGQVIIVKPSTTSTVANSKIKLNDFEAYNMRYNNANITTSTDSIVWSANVASMFIFDGTYWQFLGHGLDSNTTYGSMSVDEGITGTATSTRSLTATNLKQIIQGTKLKGLVTTNDADVVASDSITIGIGKLQAQSTETKSILEDKQNTLNAGIDLEIIRYPVGETTIDGAGSITLGGAKANSLNSVTLYGACSQSSAPTPTNPVNITCNNGVIGWDSTNNVITVTGTTETVTDSLNNTATAEMLLAVGDFKDEQELLSGNVTHKFRVLVLNGTETWTKTTSAGQFYNTVSDIEQSVTGTNTCLCTHFVQAENNTQTEGLTGLFSVRLNHNGFLFSWDSSKTVAQWQAWLAEQYSNGTPVIVIYPLETPTTETVTAQTLNTQSGNNTLTITQASLNNLALSANYEAMGDVINFTGAIGNGTITINQGGTPKGTFTTNQNGNTTIDLDAGSTVDQTFDGTSTNAQSGIAISGELGNFVQKEDVSVWTPRVKDTNLGNYNTWDALAYDGTKFVALGYEGYISTSTDGITWTSIIQNTELGENYWNDLVYNGVSFIALGLHGYTSTSTDGITWTAAVQNTNLGLKTWRALAYDGTKFVALGQTGYISTSTDGISWTEAVQSVELGEHVWEYLAYDGTKFVALGQTGYISTSTDGITWTTAVQNTNLGLKTWRALAYDGTKFVALGQTGYISTSTDGISWTEAVRDTNLGSSSWRALTYSGTKFVALGQSGYVSTSSGFTHLLNIQNNLYIDFTNNNKFNLLDGLTGLIPDERLSTNIARTSSIGNGTITFTQGGVTKGTITTNQSGDATIDFDVGGGGGAVDSVNGQTGTVVLTASDVGALADTTTIPSKTSDLTNDSGFITGITSSDVTTALEYTPYNSTNPDGYITSSALNGYATETWVGNQGYITGITSSDVITALTYTPYNGATNPNGYITSADLPTNYVTTDTAQDISGRKTFLGEKAIYFKQSATTNKLGFTLYNPSNTELGALEYRPNTISGSSLLNLNCPQTTGDYVGFRYWGTPAVNIIAPKVATAGNYFIPTHITDGNTTVTASNTGTVNISTLLPDISTKQDTLVSGTNIKTINNESILGSGNLSVLQNTAIGTNSLSILGSAVQDVFSGSVNIGNNSHTNGDYGLALGYGAEVDASNSAIQLGYGSNIYSKTLSVGFYNNSSTHYNWQLLDGTTGLIPDARLSSNIARTTNIPTAISDLTDDTATYPIDKADTLTGLTASIAELNYTDGVTSNIQTQLDGKVNSSDIWYDSSSSTLYIGVPQS